MSKAQRRPIRPASNWAFLVLGLIWALLALLGLIECYWALLGLTALGNLYDKLALKRTCLGLPDFGLFLLYFLIIFSSKQVFFLSNTPKMTNSDHCFPYEINWCH